MSYTFKILSEYAELTAKNVMLNWQIEQYESLINELMAYLCQEDGARLWICTLMVE